VIAPKCRSATTDQGHHLFVAEAQSPKVQWTPEAIIADQNDARLLVTGIGGFWGGAALSGLGSILDWPPLIWFGVAMAFALGTCFLTLQWRVARRLNPERGEKSFASSMDEFAAGLHLMRPSVIGRALRLSR